jgi:formylglycine-generating enzyme required for sulfatase activity
MSRETWFLLVPSLALGTACNTLLGNEPVSLSPGDDASGVAEGMPKSADGTSSTPDGYASCVNADASSDSDARMAEASVGSDAAEGGVTFADTGGSGDVGYMDGGDAGYGRDADASDTGSGPPCTTPGATECFGAAYRTCGTDGGWSAPWPCATGECQQGSCVGATTSAPSCASGGDGLTNCGPDGGESCCASPEVPGGSFFRTFDGIAADGSVALAPDGGPTGLADPAAVSGFRLDKYLVTVGRFRQFVAAWNGGSGFAPAGGSGKHAHLNGGQGLIDVGGSTGEGTVYEPGWVESDDANIAPSTPGEQPNFVCNNPVGYSTWTPTPGSYESAPMDCINWYEAYAFCIWDGGFLPSDAELEYATAGGDEQRPYPWGWTDPGTANQYEIYGGGPNGDECYYPTGSLSLCQGVSSIAKVGTAVLGAGKWGQLDLLGEVHAWVLDVYAPFAPCSDCAFLQNYVGTKVEGGVVTSELPNRTIRGSTFANPTAYSWTRYQGPPSFSYFVLGLRCARTP